MIEPSVVRLSGTASTLHTVQVRTVRTNVRTYEPSILDSSTTSSVWRLSRFTASRNWKLAIGFKSSLQVKSAQVHAMTMNGNMAFLNSISMDDLNNELVANASVASFSTMSSNSINTYFGDAGRSLFNQRCQMMNRQSKIIACSKKERISSTYFADRGSNQSRGVESYDELTCSTARYSRRKKVSKLRPLAIRDLLAVSNNDQKPQNVAQQSQTANNNEPTIILPLMRGRHQKSDLSLVHIKQKDHVDEVVEKSEGIFRSSVSHSASFGSARTATAVGDIIDEDRSSSRIGMGYTENSSSGSFDDVSCYTLDEQHSILIDARGHDDDDDDDDDDEMSIGSTESVFENETLSVIADEGYKASSVAQPLTPRTRFISTCITEGLNPRASLVIRRHMSTHLKLSHYSIGDKVACILAASLVDLPEIESIDISDNILTDVSLEPLLHAITNISGLVELNLSSNTIGPKAAKAISLFLSSPGCPLKKLILQNADVDDYECERFITSIQNNSTLTEIDLSSNQIGSAEALNVVKPELVTGGEAIAGLLRSPVSQLKILKLSWNMIRLHSAVDLASSLSVCPV